MSDEQTAVETKPTTVIVTSENLAEFTNSRLGLVDKAETPVADVQSEPEPADNQSEQAAKDLQSDDKTERKPNSKLEKRFSEITRQREAAKAEAQREKAQREALEAKLAALESKQSEHLIKKSDSEEPKPENFGDMFEYAKALAEYTTERKLAEREKVETENKVKAARSELEKAWANRVDETRKALPDFDDMIASADVFVSDAVRDAILDSEHGPRILYHLAENPEIAETLRGKSIIASLREIGKLEARFEKSQTEKVEKIPVTSKAPKPINPIRGTVATAEVGLDADNKFSGTYAQWKAARMAGRIK